MKIYFIATLIMSLITFIAYGKDKSMAKKHLWRTPEATLLLLALLGGSIGAVIGMNVFHHKTQKTKFKVLVPLCLIIWISLGIFIFIKTR